MRIALLAPFFSGSHRRWAEELTKHSSHEITLLTLPGRHWKWRMHGAAVSLMKQVAEYYTVPPDLFLTTDMLDVASFRGLLPPLFRNVPVAVYFHENQLTYPWSPTDPDRINQRDRHYAWLNYTTTLASDRVFFNSDYHRQSFLDALPTFLGAFPDYQERQNVDHIAAKSSTLPLGMELRSLDQYQPAEKIKGPPILLWNHRWEFDKNPEAFFTLCYRLQEENIDFRLVVLGEHYRKSPSVFAEAQERLQSHLLHWGYAEDARAYYRWLWQADILPVTSQQDFFGGSVVEAIYCACYPILPNRLAYPEHIPSEANTRHFYESDEELYQLVLTQMNSRQYVAASEGDFSSWVAQYDWEQLIAKYDAAFESREH